MGKLYTIAAATALVCVAGQAQATVTTSTVGLTTTYTENFNAGSSFAGGVRLPDLLSGDGYLLMATGVPSATFAFSSASAIASLTLGFWYSQPDIPVFADDQGSVKLVGGAVSLPYLGDAEYLLNNPGPGGSTADRSYSATWSNLAAGTYTLQFDKGANFASSLKVDDVVISVTAVPEPYAIALALAGGGVLAGVAMVTRGRRRRDSRPA